MSGTAQTGRRGEAASRISTRIVSAFKERTGRGPTRSRTFIRDNLVVVLLEDNLTRAERSLVADGKPEAVDAIRRALQDTMQGTLCEVVEQELGRRVVAFMSANHVEPDYMTEIFVLDADADVVADLPERFDGAMLSAVLDPRAT